MKFLQNDIILVFHDMVVRRTFDPATMKVINEKKLLFGYTISSFVFEIEDHLNFWVVVDQEAE